MSQPPTPHFSPQQYGDNPAYDREQRRLSAVKQRFYQHIAEKHRAERRMEELQPLIDHNAALVARLTEELREASRLLAEYRTEAEKLQRETFDARKIGTRLREEAIARGEKLYLTGIPCKNGHVDFRYVSSGACQSCDEMYGRVGYTKRRAVKENDDGLHGS